MSVITRFPPSPTGYLHIGGARTALFNYLFARHHGGQFRLRIEDTDRARSTPEAVAAIIDGLSWLGLRHDGEIVYQYARAAHHGEVAREMIARGQAYYCYMSPQEIEAERETAKASGKPWRYDRRWRDRPASDAPKDISPVVRLRAPLDGEITIQDHVQGTVTVACKELDDMVLLRADGTPTYMLAVVVDDHDMGVTHVIRGDDHLTNAFRQILLYRAMGWEVPEYAHVPMIHGLDGAKLSKRHGALGVEAYRDMGFLPEALRNYLLRLGWSHGDDEVISDAQAIEWFNLEAVGKSPARLDFAKLESVNAHWLREADDARLAAMVLAPQYEGKNILPIIRMLKSRAHTLVELAEAVKPFIAHGSPPRDEKANAALAKADKGIVAALAEALPQIEPWNAAALEGAVQAFVAERSLKFGQIGPPLRALLAGRMDGPSVYEMMDALGREESVARLAAIG